MTASGSRAPFTIAAAPDPDHADFATLFTLLDQETAATVGPCAIQPFALLLRDPGGRTVGGLWARIVYAWMVVEMLFVPSTLRGSGAGSRLMEMAEAEAGARGCIGIQITRFDFQAPDFYQRLGFTPFGRQQDVPPGHCCTYLEKRLHTRSDPPHR